MSAAIHEDESADEVADEVQFEEPKELPFPPVTRQHILNCSFHSWWPK